MLASTDDPRVPDWVAIDGDLRRHSHLTLKLVWAEYNATHLDGFGLTQFKHHYAQWRRQALPGLSMHQTHRPGEAVQVDYAGDTIALLIGTMFTKRNCSSRASRRSA